VCSREDFCKKVKLNPKKSIVAYTPTWVSKDLSEQQTIVEQVKRVPNYIVLQHPDGKRLQGSLTCPRNLLQDLLYHADIIAGDTSSILLEFLSIRVRPVVQIIKQAYSDNPGVTVWDPPLRMPEIPQTQLPFLLGALDEPKNITKVREFDLILLFCSHCYR
jgi:hypothetical protein